MSKILEIALKSKICRPSKKVVDDYKPWGISITQTMNCMRFNWINYNRPKEIDGYEFVYMKDDPYNYSGSLIVGMGYCVENIVAEFLKESGIFISTQDKVRDLGNKWRGNLDYLVNLKPWGYGIGDCKGMSERKFQGFLERPLKEVMFDYYVQLTSYIHIMDVPYGFIVGVNRSNGKVEVRVITKEETKDDFLFYRGRVKQTLDAQSVYDLPIEEDKCHGCSNVPFCHRGKPELIATFT
jgi:hypothetical protein